MSEGSDSTSYEIMVPGTADGGDRVPDLSPREARDRWLNKLRVSKAEASVAAYHYQTKIWVEWCEREGIATVDELTGWDIESYEAERRANDVKPLTLQKEMLTLRRFLEYLARIEVVDESLPEKVDPPDVPRDAQVDETMLKPGRAEELLDHYRNTPGQRRSRGHALLEVMWFTGARLGALRGLDTDDYSSNEQYVAFRHRPNDETPLKNGDDGERVVGLPGEVCDVLDAYIEHNRHEVYDDHGRRPLFASTVGRPSTNAVRAWTYQATVPCIHTDCPHGRERSTCEFLEDSYNNASKCPSSRSPHQVRTGSITWQRNRGVPADVVSRRVNSSVRVIEAHYDKPDEIEEMEKRRRQYLDQLHFDVRGGDDR